MIIANPLRKVRRSLLNAVFIIQMCSAQLPLRCKGNVPKKYEKQGTKEKLQNSNKTGNMKIQKVLKCSVFLHWCPGLIAAKCTHATVIPE